MPQFRAWDMEHCCGGEGLSDVAAGDGAHGGLDARPEDRVGGARDSDPGCPGVFQKLPGRSSVQGQGFLAPHALAGSDNPLVDFDMYRRDREVHDDLDLIDPEQILHSAMPGNPIGLRLRAGPVRIEVGDEQHPQVWETGHVFKVCVGNDAGADDANPYGS